MEVLLYYHDKEFHSLYEEARNKTEMLESAYRPTRFYNLIQSLLSTLKLNGVVAEAGCYKGFSSLLMCKYLSKYDQSFDGTGYHIIDSFQGLSEPHPKDINPDKESGISPRAKTNLYSAKLSSVKSKLKEYPAISFHKGWIPDVFNLLPSQYYKFVHIDVDLYQPTFDSLTYFYSRLVKGGIIVVDDYGYLDFPGAKKAVDQFAAAKGARIIPLNTGNAIIFAPH